MISFEFLLFKCFLRRFLSRPQDLHKIHYSGKIWISFCFLSLTSQQKNITSQHINFVQSIIKETYEHHFPISEMKQKYRPVHEEGFFHFFSR